MILYCLSLFVVYLLIAYLAWRKVERNCDRIIEALRYKKQDVKK